MADTEDAIRGFLSGDEEAFGRIVRQWEKKIYNLAWRMLNNREDAQDVVQETFLSVFRSIRNLRTPGSFPTWLFQIALNHCRSRWRSRTSDVSMDDTAIDQAGDREYLLPTSSSSGKIPDPLETVDLIQKALAGIREDHRTAIVLKEYMGLSLDELSKVMECPLSTAKSRLYLGLREVQRNLKRMGIRIED